MVLLLGFRNMLSKLEHFLSELNIAETDCLTFDTVGDLGFKMCNQLHLIAERISRLAKEQHACIH